jgi:NAD(P)-dependent dehydrogenase (short-subunit alcohol dehydrogenase family)
LTADVIKFDGQVVVVTGAAGGLGRAYAEAIGRRGATVVVHDAGVARDGTGSDPSVSEEVADDLSRHGMSVESRNENLATKAGCDALVTGVLQRHGRLDALVHSAGIVRYGSISETTVDEWRRMLAVNVEAAWWLARAAWPAMVAAGYGRLVFTASGYGLRAYDGSDVTAYGVGKAAQFGLMNGLAGEGADQGIKVNAIEPIAATRIFRRSTPPDELTADAVAPAAVALAARECLASGMVVNAADGEFQVQRYPASERAPLTSGGDPAEGLIALLGRVHHQHT